MPGYEPIHTLLERSADAAPDAVALVHGSTRLTYGEIESAANRTAAWLRSRGVERGDRVGLLCENGAAYVTGFFGILKAGGCAVALDNTMKPPKVAALLEDSGAVGLVTHLVASRATLPEIVAAAPRLRFALTDTAGARRELPRQIELGTAAELAALADARAGSGVDEGDLAAILYTSGSTGRPRGATLLHRNLAANTRQILGYLQLTAEDSVLVVLPFHYSFGKSLLLNHFAVGGRVVIENRFAYPASVLDSLDRERATGFSGVPSTYAILATRTDFLSREKPSLRYLTQAGGAMSPELTLRIREALPERIRVFVMYGQTEASARLSYVPPERLREKLGSIGIPIPGVRLIVTRPDGSACEPGEVGEIVAEGDNIMAGYWNDPQETAGVLREGRLWTGDLARRDRDGFLWVVDRKKNMIKCGAHRISPREIEETILELPEVAEACVVGVPDPILGEAIEAFVVPRAADAAAPAGEAAAALADGGGEAVAGMDAGPPDERAVLRHCGRRLAPHKIPRRVTFLAALPRGSAGKVLKAELVRMAQGGLPVDPGATASAEPQA